MKITKSQLKEIIREEVLTERLKRFKVFVSGEKEPLILMGKNEKEVKQTAHMMIKNSSVKIRKVVKEAMSRRIAGKTIKIPQPGDFGNDMDKYFKALKADCCRFLPPKINFTFFNWKIDNMMS